VCGEAGAGAVVSDFVRFDLLRLNREQLGGKLALAVRISLTTSENYALWRAAHNL
jgi:hypothetical protein